MELIITPKTDKRLLQRMAVHYSQPKGFVGRSICYAITHDSIYYGHIVAGSSTKYLPGRNEFFSNANLNTIVNNVFYNISKINGAYPYHNFTSSVLRAFMDTCLVDWYKKYGDSVVGFETLIELPRTGELYKRCGFVEVGQTKGYTCKRISGKGTDSWSGKRVWNTDKNSLRPKLVLCYKGK